MKIAVEGCAHGELENIYTTIKEIEGKEKIKIDLLICCGDFQSSRNEEDLRCMAVPEKYYNICSFYKYYNGEKHAPILTIFIGGNHEASNYLQELPYGGWVAPNIYYMGHAGVINVGGVRIGGLSGIYKGRDFFKGRFEKAPYDDNTKRSVYHIRNLDVFRLKQLSEPIDIFLSHDWPTGVYNFGNTKQLLKKKPFFRDEIERGQLGSKPCEELLNHLKPKYWFSAHLHCKFAALIKHKDNKMTRFLALDKCLPKRKFLQIVEIKQTEEKNIEISYDLEWLTVLYSTNHLLNVKNINNFMPGLGGNERFNFTPTEEEKTLLLNRFQDSLRVPCNFRKTAVSYVSGSPLKRKKIKQPEAKLNPQTVEFCNILGVDDPVALVSELKGISLDLSIIEDSNISSSSCLLTPDNTTFISDTDLSMSFSQSQIDSDSIIEAESIIDSEPVSGTPKEISSSTNKSISKIILPEPKNIIDIGNSESKTDMDTACVNDSMVLSEHTTNESEIIQAEQVTHSSDSIGIDSSNVPNKIPEYGTQELEEHGKKEVNDAGNEQETISDSVCDAIVVSPKRTIDALLETECVVKDDSAAEGNNSVTSEIVVSKVDVKDGGEAESSPQPKKFKRRNAEIYKALEDN